MIPLLLFACSGTGTDTDTDTTACTTEARASVTVLITDAQSQPLTPDGVSFSVDGAEAQAAECVNSDCTQWIAGWERTGVFEVTATLGEQVVVGETDVGLDASGCHVAGQGLTLSFGADTGDTGDTGA
jgi:hypothetical protein